jgi:hypothetical protein
MFNVSSSPPARTSSCGGSAGGVTQIRSSSSHQKFRREPTYPLTTKTVAETSWRSSKGFAAARLSV